MIEFYLIIIPTLLLLAWLIWIGIDFHYEYTSQYHWKTIYDGHSEFQLELGRYTITNDILGKKCYKLLKSQKCKLSINIDGKFDTYAAHINEDNVCIIGDFDEYSKITKIEYRPVGDMRKIFCEYRSPIQKPNVDIELRITVDRTKHEKELRLLLGD